jgi:hypothetical protein
MPLTAQCKSLGPAKVTLGDVVSGGLPAIPREKWKDPCAAEIPMQAARNRGSLQIVAAALRHALLYERPVGFHLPLTVLLTYAYRCSVERTLLGLLGQPPATQRWTNFCATTAFSSVTVGHFPSKMATYPDIDRLDLWKLLTVASRASSDSGPQAEFLSGWFKSHGEFDVALYGRVVLLYLTIFFTSLWASLPFAELSWPM